jgi:hypothetical protein
MIEMSNHEEIKMGRLDLHDVQQFAQSKQARTVQVIAVKTETVRKGIFAVLAGVVLIAGLQVHLLKKIASDHQKQELAIQDANRSRNVQSLKVLREIREAMRLPELAQH